jgi:hypothetical protein
LPVLPPPLFLSVCRRLTHVAYLGGQNCTVENKGCRECATGEYHDDLRGACVACGSNCALGYVKTSSAVILGQKCLNTFSTSTNTGVSRTDQEAKIGCSPCPTAAVRYVQPNSCAYMCYQDTTGESVVNDTYCTMPTGADKICQGGTCARCDVSLARLLDDYQQRPSALRYVFHFLGGFCGI